MTIAACRPKPTHFTEHEGGKWLPWKELTRFNPDKEACSLLAAIRFDNNMIFDLITGEWREWVDPKEQVRLDFFDQLFSELKNRNAAAPNGSIDCSFVELERCIRAVLDKKDWEFKK